jgi:glycosyltransferase involved in cell wall biosynthesis
MDLVASPFDGATGRIDVSIVMPCLDEAQCLPHCIANAKEAVSLLHRELGLSAEIVIADNGSTDGSQLIARALGARVVDVPRRGYGAALIAGFQAASGDYLVMGDADGSYDFREAVGLVRLLVEGADLAMGSRFRGGIARGAMPWKNRYIGNPILTGVLNVFFRAGVGDAHCGLRALTRDCFERLDLSGSGMEFASEMVIKAALKRARIAEAPVTLSKDIRSRAPHLRPWRDGWRHLRYLFMLSPNWAFQVPAALVGAISLVIWAAAIVGALTGDWRQSQFGNYWVVLAGAMLGLAHIASLMGAAAHLHGRRKGFRSAYRWESALGRLLCFETMLLLGLGSTAIGLSLLVGVLFYWSSNGAIGSVLPAVVGTTLIVIGAQNALGGMLMAVVNDHDSNFTARTDAVSPSAETPARAARRAA